VHHVDESCCRVIGASCQYDTGLRVRGAKLSDSSRVGEDVWKDGRKRDTKRTNAMQTNGELTGLISDNAKCDAPPRECNQHEMR
jgi:hypothetical protein